MSEYNCEHCHDTGLTTIENYDGNGSDADDQPRPFCEEESQADAQVAL